MNPEDLAILREVAASEDGTTRDPDPFTNHRARLALNGYLEVIYSSCMNSTYRITDAGRAYVEEHPA